MTSAARVAGLLFAVAWGTNHFVPLLPLYRINLNLSPTELAQLFGVYAVGLLPGLLAGGPLSDRFGRRRLVVPAAVVALLGSIILGSGTPTFVRLLLGRFVVGLGSGVTFSAATAWVQDLARQRGQTGTGARRAATALSSGFGGGPLVASVLAQWLPRPLALPYLVQAIILIVAIVAIATVPSPIAAATTTDPPVPSASGEGRPFLPAGFLREVVPVAPWVFGLASISFAVLPRLVTAQLRGFSVIYTGLVTATTLLAGVLVQTPLRARTPSAAGRFGVTAGLLGLVLAIVAVVRLSPLLVLVAALALGAGYGGCLVAGLRFVETRSAPADRGRVTGVFYVLAYLGFAAPLLEAGWAKRVGNPVSIATVAVLVGLSVVLRWIAPPSLVSGGRTGRDHATIKE